MSSTIFVRVDLPLPVTRIHQIRFYSVAVITSGSDFSLIPPEYTQSTIRVRATPVRFRVRPTSILSIKISFLFLWWTCNQFFLGFLSNFDQSIDRKRTNRRWRQPVGGRLIGTSTSRGDIVDMYRCAINVERKQKSISESESATVIPDVDRQHHRSLPQTWEFCGWALWLRAVWVVRQTGWMAD